MKSNRTLGMTLLAIWLILNGLMPFLNVSIPYRNVVMALLALLAGILLLIGK